MIVNKVNSQQTFKGFHNIVSHTIDIGDGNHFSFMAMELNNEGERDLDKWFKIQKTVKPNTKLSNILFIQNLSFFDKNLYSLDDQMINMYNDFAKENYKFSKERETFLLKANSFAASLTRRIASTENHTEDGKLHLVLADAIKKITTILSGNFLIASDIGTQAACKKVKHRITANNINEAISKNMGKYFKL